MDITTGLGILLGVVAILGGRILEGGNPATLLQITAFWIVGLGTFATMVIGASGQTLRQMPKTFRLAFLNKDHDPTAVIPLIVKFAEKARREGLLSLEREISGVNDPFIAQGLQLVADGTDPAIVKTILETEIAKQEERHGHVPTQLEAAGGYAPTIGIIGAVLGLIHVMEHMSEGIDKVGDGIAVAFVATVYGLFIANMLCFPIASKLRAKSKEEILVKEMILEGILSIQAGDNPRIIEEKLKSFLSLSDRQKFDAAKESARA